MKTKTLGTWISVVAGGVLLAGCQNLNLPDTNAVTLAQSIQNAGTLEETVGSATKYWAAVLEGLDARQGVEFAPSEYMQTVDEEMTAGSDLQSMFTFSGNEPRQQFSNQNANPSWLNRIPNQDFGTAGAMCNSVLGVIKAGTVKVGVVSAATPQGSHTDRDHWWCEYIIGSINSYRGIMFDQGIPVPDTTPISLNTQVLAAEELPHDSLDNIGIGQMKVAIKLGLAAPADTTSNVWLDAISYNNTDAVKIMYSTLARSITMVARNTEERATLPVGGYTWNNVITWVDSGITAGYSLCVPACPSWSVDGQPTTFSQPGGLVQQGNGNLDAAYNAYDWFNEWDAAYSPTSTTAPRVSIRFLGPYDTTGAWQWWLGTTGQACLGATTCAGTENSCGSYTSQTAICNLNDTLATWTNQARTDTTVGSPDKRINAYKAGVPQKGSTSNANNGLYFGRFRCDGTSTAAIPAASNTLGSWSQSNYIFIRDPTGIVPVAGPDNGEGPYVSGCVPTSGIAPFEGAIYTDMSPEEFWFLLAEAYIRTGNSAAAANIINVTRQGVGGLPAVTVAGVPAGTSCIPRNEDGTCANLMMAMFYEKRIELIGESMLNDWSDWRAFGKFLQGSMMQMPPEARELFALGLIPGGSSVAYSYGQTLPGSAYVSCTGIIVTGANVAGCTSIYP